MVNSHELICTTECLTLYARCRINRCRYNRVRLYLLYIFSLFSFTFRNSSLVQALSAKCSLRTVESTHSMSIASSNTYVLLYVNVVTPLLFAYLEYSTYPYVNVRLFIFLSMKCQQYPQLMSYYVSL